MSALPPLMSLYRAHALPVVNAVTRSLTSTTRSRAVRIGFDPAADSIRIRSIKIGFDPNSVLESVRTLETTSGSGFHFIFEFSVTDLTEKDINVDEVC